MSADVTCQSNLNGGQEAVTVAVRVRPMNDRELREGQDKIYKCLPGQNAITQCKGDVDGVTYHFDKVFDETIQTHTVYQNIATEIVKGVTMGINGTIFAYGQTSSGKTHTMLGGNDHRGILEMAAEDTLNHIANCPDRDFLLRVSFVEIYNENIRDLLSDATDTSVAIREDPKKGVYCETTEVIITDYESIIRALKKGIAKRAVEATAMNDTSSRSHTIFRLVVESKASSNSSNTAGGGGSSGGVDDGAVLVASLNLVDLAGSESVRHTGATGQRAKEGGKINQSLLSLSRVIHALSQPGQHVSFRDSKLTRLLQPSLSGNAKMAVVCCITPAEKYLEETRSTLQFASRAKLVQTQAKVNEVLDESAQLKRLKRELEELKEKQRRLSLASSQGVGLVGMRDSEEYARLEREKNELQSILANLHEEKEQQSAQLERLRDLIVSGGGVISHGSAKKEANRKRKMRDTWCPGANGVPPPYALLHSLTLNENDNSFGSRDSFPPRHGTTAAAISAALGTVGGGGGKGNSSRILADVDRSTISSRGSLSPERSHILSDDKELAELREQLSTALAEISALKEAQIESANQLEIELGAFSESEKELKNEIESLKSCNKKLSEELAESKQMIENLNEKLEDANCTQDLSIDSDDNDGTVEFKESKALRAATAAATTTAAAPAAAEAEAAREEIAKANALVEEKDSIIAEKEATIAEKDATLAEKDAMIAEKDASLEEKESLIVSLREQIEGLNTSHADDLEQIQKMMDAKDAEAEKTASALSSLQEQFDSIHESHREEMRKMEEMLTDLQSQLEGTHTENETLRESINDAKACIEKTAMEQAEIMKEWEAKSVSSQETIASLTQRYNDLSKEAVQLRETAAGRRNRESFEGGEVQVALLRQEILDSHAREEELSNAIQEADTELTSHKEMISQLEGQVEDLNEQIVTLEKQLEESVAEVEMMKQSNIEAENRCNELSETVSELTLQLQDKDAELESSIREVEEQLEQLQQLKQQLEEKEAELEDERERSREISKELEIKENELTSAVAAAAAAEAAAAEAEASTTATTTTTTTAASDDALIVDLYKQINALTVSLRDKEADLEMSSEANAKITKAHHVLQSEMESMSAALEQEKKQHAETYANLSEELNEAMARVQELTDALVEAENQTQSTTSCSMMAVISSSSSPSSSSAELESKISELTFELTKSRRNEEDLQHELESATLSLELAREEKDEMDQTIVSLREEIASLTQELASLTQTCEDKQKELDAAVSKATSGQSLHADLMDEMNALLEAKLDIESRAQAAEAKCEALQLQMKEMTKESAREQEMLMKAADVQIASLKVTLEEKEGKLEALEGEKQVLWEKLTGVEEKHAETLALLSAAEQAAAAATASAAATAARHATCEDCLVKDKRIAHLEASKLTQAQMDKIKLVKEERKKFQEDAKVLKKQLLALKSAYDALVEKHAAAAASSGASETAASAASTMVETLKGKLRDCHAQLQEYEKEWSAVSEIMSQHGIDMQPLDCSIDDVSTAEQDFAVSDIAGAVNKLVVKLTAEHEQKLNTRLSAMEKMLETLKEERDTAVRDVDCQMESCDALSKEVDDLKEQLEIATKKLSELSSEKRDNLTATATEIQCLEEENIELMRECKTLRKQISKLNQQLAASQQAAASVNVNANVNAIPPVPPASSHNKRESMDIDDKENVAVTHSDVNTLSAKKPGLLSSFAASNTPSKPGNNHHNTSIMASPAPSSVTKNPASSSARVYSTGKNVDPLSSSSSAAAAAVAAAQGKKRTKAKPLVNATAVGEAGDAPGECAQS